MKTVRDYPLAHKLLHRLKQIPGLHKVYRSAAYWLQYRQNQKQRKDLLGNGKVIPFRQAIRQFKIDTTLDELAKIGGWQSLKLPNAVYYSSGDGFAKELGTWMSPYPDHLGMLVFPGQLDPEMILEHACKMEFLEIGPRVYDLITLEHGTELCHIIIADKVDLEATSKRQLGALMQQIQYLKSKRLLRERVVEGQDKEDVLDDIRDSSGISREGGGGLCLDPMLFDFADRKILIDYLFEGGFESLQFTDVPWYRNKVYPYQSIPSVSVNAKRDMEVRWASISELLQEHSLSLEDRMVLDVCCSSGIFMSFALAEGASWALGWDIPDVAAISEKLQRILSFSKTEIFGAELHDKYILTNDIPTHLKPHLDDCALFLFSAVAHVGFIEEIKDIPWRFLVFEGHEADDPDERKRELEAYAEEWGARLCCYQSVHDGDSFPRPLAIITR